MGLKLRAAPADAVESMMPRAPGGRDYLRRSKTPWIAPPVPKVPANVKEFFREVPGLFRAILGRERDAYEEVIYRMDRPVTPAMIARAVKFRASGLKRPSEHHLALLASAVQRARYPDPRPLLLASRSRLPLDAAVRALHFANPAFPLWDERVAAGLRQIVGKQAPRYRARLDRQGISEYAKFVRLIVKWREAISFHHVPEEPYFLARVIEGALTAKGNVGPGPDGGGRLRKAMRRTIAESGAQHH
jgi:hypothetical protein